MKNFFKFLGVLSLIGFLLFWLIVELLGWGVGYVIDSRKSWNEVKDLPVVAAMGHWNEIPYQEAFPLKSELFPKDMNKNDWVRTVEASGFRISEEDDKCDFSDYSVDSIKKFDTCASRIVGPTNCSYLYYVAANFEKDKLSDVVGTRSAFICM